jgi:hypothetical protein
VIRRRRATGAGGSTRMRAKRGAHARVSPALPPA